MRFDGDAALAFQIHGIENLGLHLARVQGTRVLEKAIRQRRLPVVDVSDDGEIADVAMVHGGDGAEGTEV